MSTDLAIPTPRELEALSPSDRWDIEDAIDQAQGAVREFNDAELRRWVEDEGKTQTEVSKIVGRSTSQISRRCIRLGIESPSNRGRPRISPEGNSDEEVIDAEVVEDDAEEVTGEIVGYDDDSIPAAPSVVTDDLAPDRAQNLRSQLVEFFDQMREVRGLLKAGADLIPRSAEDRKALLADADRTMFLLNEIKKELRK